MWWFYFGLVLFGWFFITILSIYLFLIGHKLNFLQVKSVLPMTVAGERSPCPCPDLRGFLTSSPSALLRRENERAAGWVLAGSQGKATSAINKIISHLTPNLRHTPEAGEAGVSSSEVPPPSSGAGDRLGNGAQITLTECRRCGVGLDVLN